MRLAKERLAYSISQETRARCNAPLSRLRPMLGRSTALNGISRRRECRPNFVRGRPSRAPAKKPASLGGDTLHLDETAFTQSRRWASQPTCLPWRPVPAETFAWLSVTRSRRGGTAALRLRQPKQVHQRRGTSDPFAVLARGRSCEVRGPIGLELFAKALILDKFVQKFIDLERRHGASPIRVETLL